ncbi:scavenger receptor class F member 2-like isoform X2 [Mercenaria mercenaria]|uniref:scavenger receptor class F member 2-like isoform X2 n=1 Tax=Mercenaria mercenaria TaxID=6596 RepID=UPI00234E7821|nr:scavenger receptor class F member 2-like isoform X2 [Mercenaria mercenaria]
MLTLRINMDINKYKFGVFCLTLMLHFYVSAKADVECSGNCLETDDEKLACDLVTHTCLHGCKDGFGGSDCSLECCFSCKTCTANESMSVVCIECIGDFFLDRGMCMPCSRSCANGTCRASDGYCELGCQAGYYGNTCAEKCSNNCKDRICRADNGTCISGCSLSVLHGPHCSKACNQDCINRECDQNGVCVRGCYNHAWKPDCSMRCSGYCMEPPDHYTRVCDLTSGQCLYGCVNGTYWGENCTSICNTECQGQKCDFKSGECTHGCTEGYKGRNCTEKISEDSGLAAWKIALIVIGIVVGLAILICLIVWCMCGMRQQ